MIPHIAGTYREYLANKTGVQEVFPAKPATRPPKCIVLRQIPASAYTAPSGYKPDIFAWRRFLIQNWNNADATGDTAEVDSESIRDIMVQSRFHISGVHRVVVVGEPGRYDDPRESTPRYQQTIDVLVKGVFR